jgi:alpha-L-arabinofuranosidase
MSRPSKAFSKISPNFLVLLLAFAAPAIVPAQVTTINVNNRVLQSPVKRFGINLGTVTSYDSGQMLKNLIVNNPGFEGEIAQSMIQCGSGTATSCMHANYYSGWPNDFWDGATYQFVYGNALGRSGTVTTYVAANATTMPATGGVFNFADSGVTPGSTDYMIVRKAIPGNAADGWNSSLTGNGSISTNLSDLPPGTQGIQTIQLTAPTSGDGVSLLTYFDSTAGRTFLQMNGTYQLSFKAKGLGAKGAGSVLVKLLRFVDPKLYYVNQTVNLATDTTDCTAIPNGNGWQNCSFTFNASENGSVIGTAQLEFDTVGASSFYLDDVSLVQTGTDPTNPTVFRDPVVNALKQFNPGVIRFWATQLGESLDNMLAPPLGRQRSTYSSYAIDTDAVDYGLTDFLQLCKTVGADPWVVVPITLSDTEASNLIDYLAGSTSTVYGAKRAAAGQIAPWTTVFNKIHLEFGNEAWDSIFNGGDMEIWQAYGTRSQAVFAAMRNNSAFNAPSFDLIINGLAGYAPATAVMQAYCNNNDSVAAAPYMMYTINDPGTTGAALNENLFGSTFAEAEAFVTPSGTAENVANGYVLQDIQSVPKPFLTTEFNISPRQGTITQAELDLFASSVGAGIAVADGMLQQLRAGVLTQNLFELAQYQNTIYSPTRTTDVFGAVLDMGVTDRRRPQFLAVQMANTAIATSTATMLQTVHTGADPTWNQPLVQDVQLNNVHYLQSFAFNNNNQYSLIVINTDRTTAHPVTFAGDNVPAGTVQMQQLTSANITDTNENSLVVAPVSSKLTNFNPATPLSLPPFSMTVLTWSAPQISGITVTGITATSATISWTTDVAASGQVIYGTTTDYGSQSAPAAAATTQSITLTGLTAGQTYNFSVVATNTAGATASSANATFTTPASFTISAPASISQQQGAQNSYPVTVTPTNGYSGSVSLSLSGLPVGTSDTFQGTSTGATLVISIASTAPPGTYALTLSGTAGATVISTPISLIITQSQTITFNAIPSQIVGGTLTLSATASSGLPVTFSVVPNGNCSISGNVVTFLNTGNCGVVANQGGNSTYAPAPQVGQIIVVNNPTTQTITFGTIVTQTVGTTLALTATASSGLTVGFASSTATVCTVSGSTATFLAAGTCTITASQPGNNVYSAAKPVSQSFTVKSSGATGTTTTVSLGSAANIYGIFNNGSTVTNGGLDTSSYAYSANLLGTSVSSQGIPYMLGAAGSANAMTSTTLALPTGSYSALNLLGTAIYGNQAAQTFTVTYTDNTTSTFTQSLSDWGTPQSYTGETIASTMAYRLTPNGSQTSGSSWYLYSYSFALNNSKTVKSFSLPNSRNVVVLAVTLSGSASQTAQTITFGTVAAQTVGTPLTLSATASSGLAVSYASSTTSICTVSGSTATFLAAGTCTITASQAGNASYAAATPVAQSFTVNAASTSTAMRFIPVTPFRAVDTRNSSILASGTSRSFTISGVPSGALAYSMNVTVVPSGTLQSLTVYPTGGTQPSFPLMSSDGRVKAQAAIIQAGTGGAVTVAASNATQVILDVNGYFVAASNSSGLAFYPITPARLFDTRSGTALAAGSTQNFAIQSTAGIPSTAQAYSLNITAVPTGTLGNIIVWPAGQAQPSTSTLNATTNITANAVIMGAGTNGSISVFTTGATNLLIDINGYWAPAGSGGLSLYPVTPVRAYTSGTTNISGTVAIPAPASSTGIPANANAFLMNATVTPPSSLGYLALWAAGTAQPNVSTLNANDGSVTSNLAIVGTTNGSVNALALNPTLLTLDVYGYFAP